MASELTNALFTAYADSGTVLDLIEEYALGESLVQLILMLRIRICC